MAYGAATVGINAADIMQNDSKAILPAVMYSSARTDVCPTVVVRKFPVLSWCFYERVLQLINKRTLLGAAVFQCFTVTVPEREMQS
jgi:hypothetical protein